MFDDVVQSFRVLQTPAEIEIGNQGRFLHSLDLLPVFLHVRIGQCRLSREQIDELLLENLKLLSKPFVRNSKINCEFFPEK